MLFNSTVYQIGGGGETSTLVMFNLSSKTGTYIDIPDWATRIVVNGIYSDPYISRWDKDSTWKESLHVGNNHAASWETSPNIRSGQLWIFNGSPMYTYTVYVYFMK